MTYNVNNKIHRQRLKVIRRYVSFDYNLNQPLAPYKKRKIKRYYDHFKNYKNVHQHNYHPRNKVNKRDAYELTQTPRDLTQVKSFPILTSGETVRVKRKKGKLHVITEYSDTEFIYLDPWLLADDPVNYVNAKIAESGPAEFYQIQTGPGFYPGDWHPELVAEKVKELLDNDKYKDHELWLTVLRKINFKNQASQDAYRKARVAAGKRKKRQSKRSRVKGRS